jgi:hypothetical protein
LPFGAEVGSRFYAVAGEGSSHPRARNKCVSISGIEKILYEIGLSAKARKCAGKLREAVARTAIGSIETTNIKDIGRTTCINWLTNGSEEGHLPRIDIGNI